jgi:anti-anti-sigma factor
MSIIDRDGESAVITPQTDILSSEAARFKDDLRELINNGVKHLTINCQHVEMVDSLGVGLVIAAHNSLLKVGGELRLVNTRSEVYDLLVSMRLNTHLEIQPANNDESGS